MEVREPDFTASGLLLLGAKFPTGDSSRLKEEFDEIEIPGAPESGIHGHDLTLGTGSYDGIFGAQTPVRYKKTFFEAEVQNSLGVAMGCMNTISPTTFPGVAGPVTISSGTRARF